MSWYFIYQSEAVGDETTRIYYIGFKGDAPNANREAGSKLDVPAQNAADAPLVDKLAEKNAARQSTIR